MRRDGRRQMQIDHARLDDRAEVRNVDLQDARHPRE
jgi:hypothetical protein